MQGKTSNVNLRQHKNKRWQLKMPENVLVILDHSPFTEWRYHTLLVYNYVLLKMSTWYSKHVGESNNIWRINNIQCITLVVLYGQFMMLGQRNIKLIENCLNVQRNNYLNILIQENSVSCLSERVVGRSFAHPLCINT